MKIDDEKLAFSQSRQDRRGREKQSLGTITIPKKEHNQFSLQNKKTDTEERSQGLPNTVLHRSPVIGLRERPGSGRIERLSHSSV